MNLYKVIYFGNEISFDYVLADNFTEAISKFLKSGTNLEDRIKSVEFVQSKPIK